MDPSSPAIDVLAVVGVVAGIVGVVVPALPGLLLCWVSVLAWTLLTDAGAVRWVVLGLATGCTVLGTVVKYAWPGRRLAAAGVPTSTLLAGAVGALSGMVVLPVVGIPIGFVAGVWAAEWLRLGNAAAAWPSARQAVLGAGLSVLVELVAATGVLATLVAGIILT